MQRIGDIASGLDLTKENDFKRNDYNTFTEEDCEFIEKLFKNLTGIFPAFRQAWPDDEIYDQAKLEWMKAFKQVGLNQQTMIQRGIERFRIMGKAFVPTPGEFIEMCKLSPEDRGLLSVEMAYREACLKSHPTYGPEKNWSHPSVKWAARQTSSHTLCNFSRKESFPIFERFYLESINLLEKGELKNQIEDKRDITDEIKKQEATILPQYKNSRGLGDALKILKGGYVDTKPKQENN